MKIAGWLDHLELLIAQKQTDKMWLAVQLAAADVEVVGKVWLAERLGGGGGGGWGGGGGGGGEDPTCDILCELGIVCCCREG